MNRILDNSYADMTATRDLFNGTSFRISEWTPGTFYSHDKQNIDFIAFQGSLLYCSKSHWSNEENKPILFVNEYGIATGLQPNQYWTFIFGGANQFNEGIPVLMPKFKIEGGNWYISYDEGYTWTVLGQATGDQGNPGNPGQTIIPEIQFKIENGDLYVSYNTGEWINLGRVAGNDGNDGIDGSYPEDIVYVKHTDVLFGKSNSPYSEPTSWESAIELWTEGTYIWTRNIVEYSDGKVEFSNPVCITGNSGASGKGIESVTEMYYLSSDYYQLNGGEWLYDNPGSIKNGYIWTKLKIEYTDGTIIYTNPTCSTGLAGRDGIDGKSGASIEYIYAASNKKTIDFSKSGISYPDNSWNYDSPKNPWFDNPQTVTEEYPVVWVSTRSKGPGNDYWNRWNPPTVHAVFGFDGPGQEYIYIRSSNPNHTTFDETRLPLPDNSWEYDAIPEDSEWSDNPIGVSQEYPIEWESVRKYNNNSWDEWSLPSIHSKFGFDAITYSLSLSNDTDQLYYREINSYNYDIDLTNVTVPRYISQFPKDANNIILPQGIEWIRDNTFKNNTSLQKIIFSDSITRLDSDIFSGCENLKTIDLPDTITMLSTTFQNATGLEKIHLGSGITELPFGCFNKCINLNNVIIPSTIDKIGNKVFWQCSKLSKIYFLSGEPIAIGSNVFDETDENLKIYIPIGAKELYSAHSDWQSYVNLLEEYDMSSINYNKNVISNNSKVMSFSSSYEIEDIMTVLSNFGINNDNINKEIFTKKVSTIDQCVSTEVTLYKNENIIPITEEMITNSDSITIKDGKLIYAISYKKDDVINDITDEYITINPEYNVLLNKIFKVYLKQSNVDYDLVLSQEVISCDSEGNIKEDTDITIQVKRSPLDGSGDIELLDWERFTSFKIDFEVTDGEISNGIWKFYKGSNFNKPSISLYVNSSIYDTENLSSTKDGSNGEDGSNALTTVQVNLYKSSDKDIVSLPNFVFDSYDIYNYQFYKDGKMVNMDGWSCIVPESNYNIYTCSAILSGNLENGILKFAANELNRYIFNIYECNDLDDTTYFHYYTTNYETPSFNVTGVIAEYKANGKTDNLLMFLRNGHSTENVSFFKLEKEPNQYLCIFNCSDNIDDWDRFEYLQVSSKIDPETDLKKYSFSNSSYWYRTYAIGIDKNNSGNILIGVPTLSSNYSGPEVIGWSELSNPNLYKWIKNAQIAQICVPMSIQKDSDGNLWYKNISPSNYTFNILNPDAEFPNNYVIEKSYLDNIGYDYYDGLNYLQIKPSFSNLHIYRNALGDNDLEYLKNAFGENNIANNMVTISNIVGTVDGNNNVVAGITNGNNLSYGSTQQYDPPMLFAGAPSISEVNKAKFRVNKDGEVTASNLNITGGSITIGDCEIRPEGIKMTGDITVKTHYDISKNALLGAESFSITSGAVFKPSDPNSLPRGYGMLGNSYTFGSGIKTVTLERLTPNSTLEAFAKALSMQGILIKNKSGDVITVSYASSSTTNALSSAIIENDHLMFLKPVSNIDDNANICIYWSCSNQF